MWISRRLHSQSNQQGAERGRVTLSGNDGIEAGATYSTRDVGMYMPYGYSSSPPVGSEAILLASADGQVLVGTKMEHSCDSGEVVICSMGGARIELKNDGTIRLNSLVIDRNGEIHNDTEDS